MPSTTLDLYRRGNAASSRFSNVRVPQDILTVVRDGKEWVEARSGGVSTFSTHPAARNWWELLEGSPYGEALCINNDHGNHYNWEPAEDMPLERFVALLRDVERHFRRL